MNWAGKRVVVTGGLGFIGGAVADALMTRGASVSILDKVAGLYGPRMDRALAIYASHEADPDIIFIDLSREVPKLEFALQNVDAVFHLAATFGGRKFVDTRQADCAKMLAVDHNVIDATSRIGCPVFAYASSACVYPDSLQGFRSRPLREDDALSTGEGWKSADNLYGFAKLMGELQCKVYHEERGLNTSACRFLTVYGPGEFDGSHAIAALATKALRKQDPFEIWGDGKQERGFTYVADIAEGMILAAEKVRDGTPINLGWEKRYSLDEVAETIFSVSGWHPAKIFHNTGEPAGPLSRALDISRAREMLGWEPKVGLLEGLEKTIGWHRQKT